MSVNHLLEEPEDVKNAKPIPDTLQVHKAIRSVDISCFSIDFFLLSSDVDPYHTQWYGKSCGHKVNYIVDSNTCNFCLQNCDEKENCEWIECSIWKNASMKSVSANNILVVNFLLLIVPTYCTFMNS